MQKIDGIFRLNTDTTNPIQTPETAIQQINLTYNPEQDRLLLRVGLSDNTELAVWLTYRVVRQLWTLLQGDSKVITSAVQQGKPAMHTENPHEAVKVFEQETKITQALQKLDFSTAYQPRSQTRHEGILLVTQCQIKPLENQANLLELVCANGLTVNMNLNNEFVLAVCNMLQIATKEAAWDLSANAAISKPAETQTTGNLASKVLH